MGEDTTVIIMAIHEGLGPDGRGDPDRILSWHAVWHGADPSAPAGEFDGSREDAIAWARQTGAGNVLIFDLEQNDLIPLQ
jgi:hypothetical protein